MDAVTLVITALSAGAGSALQDGAREVLKNAYVKLRRLAKKRVAGRPDAELALERHEAAPQKWEALLGAELSEAGAADDSDLIAAAQVLMNLVDEAGARSGKYNVTVTGSAGVQVGDRNSQVNVF